MGRRLAADNGGRFPATEQPPTGQHIRGYRRSRHPSRATLSVRRRVSQGPLEPSFFVLNVQAICNSKYHFMWVSRLTPWASHDSAALACSSLGQLLKDTSRPLMKLLIREGLCIAADEAYGDSELLAFPWPGGGRGDQWKDGYHFYQSSARIHLEKAFGQLVWRWGVLRRPLRIPFQKRPLVIQVACMLHILCHVYGDISVTDICGGDDSRGLWATDNSVATAPRQRRKGSSWRQRMTEAGKNSGRVHPPLHGS